MQFFPKLFFAFTLHVVIGQQADCPLYKEGSVKAVEVRDAYYEGKLKCLYFIADQVSWINATTKCSDNIKVSDKNNPSTDDKYVGTLASIHTHAEDQLVFEEGHKVSPYGHFWIGLRQHCSSCAFEWDDWSPYDYNQWGKGEPNNDAAGEDCVEQYCMPKGEISANDGWNDENCLVGYNFVCEVFPDGSPFSFVDNHDWPMTGGCRQGWVAYAGLCYKFANTVPGEKPGESSSAMDFDTAERSCREMDPMANVATPTDMFHMSFFAANLYNVAQNTWLGIKSTSTQDKSFHWTTQPERLQYANWDSESPSGMAGDDVYRKCVAAHWHSQEQSKKYQLGQWRDYPCDGSSNQFGKEQYRHAYACSVPYSASAEEPSNPNNCPAGWVAYRNSCYIFRGEDKSARKGWEEAQQDCQAMKSANPELENAHVGLAVIWGAYDNAFVHSIFGSDQAGRLGKNAVATWIGLQVNANSTSGEGAPDDYVYSWWDEMELVYSNWGAGEPKADLIHLPTGHGCIALVAETGRWRVVEHSRRNGGCSDPLSYVCEAKMKYSPPPSGDENDPRGEMHNCSSRHEHTYGEYCIRIHGYDQSWYEAEHRCVRDGGHLLATHSTQENDLVQNWAAAHIDPNDAGYWDMWIGLQTNQLDGFEWADSTGIDYSHWAPGHPQSNMASDTCGAMTSDGYWRDGKCIEKKKFGCKRLRIHENCIGYEIPEGPDDPDYAQKVNNLRICGDASTTESGCHLLKCCWNPYLPVNCFKPIGDGAKAYDKYEGKSGLTPGGAAGLTMFIMFLVFVPLAWFLFLRK